MKNASPATPAGTDSALSPGSVGYVPASAGLAAPTGAGCQADTVPVVQNRRQGAHQLLLHPPGSCSTEDLAEAVPRAVRWGCVLCHVLSEGAEGVVIPRVRGMRNSAGPSLERGRPSVELVLPGWGSSVMAVRGFVHHRLKGGSMPLWDQYGGSSQDKADPVVSSPVTPPVAKRITLPPGTEVSFVPGGGGTRVCVRLSDEHISLAVCVCVCGCVVAKSCLTLCNRWARFTCSVCMCVCGCVVAKSCLTLCNSMDCSLPGSPVHGLLQARTLEWAATSSSRGSSWPRIEPTPPALAGRFFISQPPVKPLNLSLFLFCVSIHLYVFLFFSQLFWLVGG